MTLTVEELIAKEEIRDLVGRYMRGLDRLDVELLRSVFHDDATTDYGFFQGGPDAFVEMAYNALKDHLANHHLIGQTNIDIKGDVAFGEIYFQAFHRIVVNDEGKFASAHDLRRTFAMKLARAGVSMPDLKTIMRHSVISTTMRFYLDEQAEEVSQRIAEKLNRKVYPGTSVDLEESEST
ncbi:MAG TPA: hypothetical protein EYQ75_16880 [Planctomycetaceae bacterium]|nr:hypothetical protein [Planctomycetaceae bacterium]